MDWGVYRLRLFGGRWGSCVYGVLVCWVGAFMLWGWVSRAIHKVLSILKSGGA